MLEQLTTWLKELAAWVLDGIVSLLRDLVVWIIDQVGGFIVAAFSEIAVPAPLAAGLQSLFGGLPDALLWLAAQLGVAACFAVIGSAHGVRLIRKFVTLFQW